MLQFIIALLILLSFFGALYEVKKNEGFVTDYNGIKLLETFLNFPKWFFLTLVCGIGAIIFISVFSERLIDYWWFSSLGDEFTQVFHKKYMVNFYSFIVITIISVTIIPVSRFLFRKLSSFDLDDELDSVQSLNFWVNTLSFLNAIVLIVIGTIQFDWKDFLFFVNVGNFGVIENIHGLDIGFYIFSLPFISNFIIYFFTYSFFLAGILLCKQMMLQNLNSRNKTGNDYIFPCSIVLLFFPFAVWLWYTSYELLVSSSSSYVLAGPGYVTANFIIPALPIISIAFILVLFYILISAFKNGYKKVQLYVGGGLLATVSMFFIGIIWYSSFVVIPDALTYERPYIQKNMEMTKWSYGLSVLSKEISINNTISQEDIKNNPEIVNNMRVHDYETSLIPMDMFQRIKPFYDIIGVDVDHYNVDGQDRLVMLSLRELNVAGLSQKNIVNSWFKYTHGYSFAAFNANEYSEQGYPKYIAMDMPNKTQVEALKTQQPRIYFGEFSEEEQSFVFLNTSINEYDYPSDSIDAEYKYQGVPKGAIKMDFFKSLIIANENSFFRMFFNENITRDSYFVINRNVLTRAKKALPFLSFDSDPLPVVTKTGIIFIMDAYIQNENVPYSKGYIRNSVKVTIDAYTGEIIPYIADKSDPIIMVWDKIFPDLMKDLSQMPKELQSHLRYPEDFMKIQMDVYKDYHVDSVERFFEGNNKYSISNDKGPFFNLTKLQFDGFDKMSMKLISAMNYENRPNLGAIVLGVWEGGPKLLSLNLKSDTPYRGATQFEKSVKSDEKMKRDLTLWDSNGKVIYGPIIPNIIGNTDGKITMYYSQPIYVNSQGEGAIPQITRIAVGDNVRVSWATTGEKALENLFNQVSNNEEIDEKQKQNLTEIQLQGDNNFIAIYDELMKKGDNIGLLKLLNAKQKEILEQIK